MRAVYAPSFILSCVSSRFLSPLWVRAFGARFWIRGIAIGAPWVVSLLIFASPLAALDYTGRLPGSITLGNGETQNHTLTAKCENQYCYFGLPGAFNPNAYSFSYSTSSGNSTLTLSGDAQQKAVFYVSNLSIGANSKLIIENIHTIATLKSLTLGKNATLEVSLLKGEKVPASEFGPSSKLDFSHGANITLNSNSSLIAKNLDYFVASSIVSIHQNATLHIEADTTRFQNTLYNQGTLHIQGSVWNVGQSELGISLDTSSLINTEGNVQVNGDFYNGGDSKVDGGFDNPSPGGGNLINYGGTINITGKLFNRQGVELLSTQDSTIQVYGGTLKVGGGIDNDANSSIIIGAYNGQLGQIESDIKNDGTIKVDLTGTGLGSFELIKGNITGANTQIEISGGGDDFINSSLQGGTITINKDEAKIKAFSTSLSHNHAAILGALDESLFDPTAANPQTIYTYGGASYLRSLSQDIETSSESILAHAAPLGVWSMLQEAKAQLNATPPHYTSRHVKKLGKQVFGNASLGLVPDSHFGFSLAPFASSSSVQSLTGTYTGVNAALSYAAGAHTAQFFATYATATPAQNLAHAANSFKSHQFLLALADRINLGSLDLFLLLHYGSSSLRSSRTSELSPTALTSSLAYNELGAEAKLASPLVISDKLLLKPYIGARYVLARHGAFSESNGTTLAPALSAESLSAHLAQVIAGLEGRYYFTPKHFLYSGAELLHALTPDSEFGAMLGSQELSFTLKNQRAYSLYLGGSAPLARALSLRAQALYGVSERGFSTLSGSLGLSYLF